MLSVFSFLFNRNKILSQRLHDFVYRLFFSYIRLLLHFLHFIEQKRNAESETSEGNSSTSSRVENAVDSTVIDSSCQDVDQQRDFNLIHSTRLSDADSSDSSSSKSHAKRDLNLGDPNNAAVALIPLQPMPTESIDTEGKSSIWADTVKDADHNRELNPDPKKFDDVVDGYSSQATISKALSSVVVKSDTESTEYPPVFT